MERDVGFKVHIQRNPATGGLDLYFVDRRFDGRYIAKPMQLEFEQYEVATNVEPSLRLFERESDELLRALAEALDELDIRTDKDAKIQGKLEAQDAHLQDMRRLVVKEKHGR